MKRSEMIKQITDVLFYGSLAARVDSRATIITMLAESDAEKILSLCEKLKMLPPPDETDPATGRILYCYYNHEPCSDDFTFDKLWEPEE